MTIKKIMRGVLTAGICGGGMAQAQPDLQGSIQFRQTLLGSLQNLPTGAPKRTFTVGGVARTAIVHVPANAAGRKLPDVFMFGGWQHSAERTQSYSQLGATGPDAIMVYERDATRASTGGGGYIDLFWSGVVLGEAKSLGADLSKAFYQALDYLAGGSIGQHEWPKFTLVSDFEYLRLPQSGEGSWTHVHYR